MECHLLTIEQQFELHVMKMAAANLNISELLSLFDSTKRLLIIKSKLLDEVLRNKEKGFSCPSFKALTLTLNDRTQIVVELEKARQMHKEELTDMLLSTMTAFMVKDNLIRQHSNVTTVN